MSLQEGQSCPATAQPPGVQAPQHLDTNAHAQGRNLKVAGNRGTLNFTDPILLRDVHLPLGWGTEGAGGTGRSRGSSWAGTRLPEVTHCHQTLRGAGRGTAVRTRGTHDLPVSANIHEPRSPPHLTLLAQGAVPGLPKQVRPGTAALSPIPPAAVSPNPDPSSDRPRHSASHARWPPRKRVPTQPRRPSLGLLRLHSERPRGPARKRRPHTSAGPTLSETRGPAAGRRARGRTTGSVDSGPQADELSPPRPVYPGAGPTRGGPAAPVRAVTPFLPRARHPLTRLATDVTRQALPTALSVTSLTRAGRRPMGSARRAWAGPGRAP